MDVNHTRDVQGRSSKQSHWISLQDPRYDPIKRFTYLYQRRRKFVNKVVISDDPIQSPR